VAFRAAAAPSADGNRLEATFSESAVSITNRIGDLGIFQLVNTGSGTVEGFGSATDVVGITQDRSVTPCGPGSWTLAATQRIVVADGVLVLRAQGVGCPTPSGVVVTATYDVDGQASTGIFAGAWGSGDVTADVAAGTSKLSGKLHLVHGISPLRRQR
jgi:hypothetical protein